MDSSLLFRTRASPRLKVPTGLPLKINWRHPLARGLFGCWVPGVTGPNDLTGVLPVLTIESPATFDGSPEGPGLKSTANDGGYYAQIGNTAYNGFPFGGTTSTGFTLYYRGFPYGNGSGNNTLFGIIYNFSQSNPFYSCVIWYNGGTNMWRAGWGQGLSLSTGSDFAPQVVGQLLSIGVTFVSTGGNVLSYNNGVLQTTNSFGAPGVDSTSTSTIVLNTDTPGTGRTPDTLCNLAVMWARALTADEMMAMHLNPYGFLTTGEPIMPTLLPSQPAAFNNPVITSQIYRPSRTSIVAY